MASPGQESDALVLAVEPRAVQTARARLGEALDAAGVDPGRRHDAILLVSELVTNAIQHGSLEGDEIAVGWTLANGILRVAVVDAARGGTAPVALTPDEDRSHGRGLRVVDQLADGWEDRIVGGRREVSFRLEL